MSFSLVASTTAGSADGQSFTSSAINTTGAKLLLAAIAYYSGGGAPTFSDSKGNVWTALTDHANGTSVIRLYYCAGTIAVGSSHTFAIASSNIFAALGVLAFSATGTPILDAQTGATATAGTIQPGSVTPSVNNGLVVTGTIFNGHDYSSINGGYTASSVAFVSGQCVGGAIAYLIQTTASATNPTWTATGSDTLAAIIAAFIEETAPSAPSSEVEYIASSVTVSSTASGSSADNATDGDLTTDWIANGTTNESLAIDLGAVGTVTRMRITPSAASAAGVGYDTYLQGASLQAGPSSSFAAGTTVRDFIPTFPFLPRLQFNDRPITPANAQFWRLKKPSGSFVVADIKLIGAKTVGISDRPVIPTISPWGGRFPTGNPTVTLTSLTTAATIYYTTDGTTPTTSSTAYSAPFALDLSGGSAVTLKVIAYDATCSTTSSIVATAVFSPWGYKPVEDWRDDRGILIEAHGGDILDNTTRDGKFYWYGFSLNRAQGSGDVVSYIGVNCYSSTDLYNWVFEGQILDNAGYSGFYRTHVLYNASTSKYVLWANVIGNLAVTATADSPAGPWTFQNTSLDPDGIGFKDFNLFRDDDGTAYVVYAEGSQSDVIISQLSSDYLTTTGSNVVAINNLSKEAPILFKRGSTYFLIASDTHPYDSTNSYTQQYFTCTSATPLGTWSGATSLFASDPVGGSYDGQSSFVVKVPGKVDGYVYGSDQWNGSNLYASRQVWLPLTFPTDTTLGITTPTSWDLSTFTDATPSTPATPTSFSITAIDATGMTVGFTGSANAGSFTDLTYQIERSTNGTDFTLLTYITGTSYKDTTTVNGVTYYYRVYASSAEFGESPVTDADSGVAQGPREPGTGGGGLSMACMVLGGFGFGFDYNDD